MGRAVPRATDRAIPWEIRAAEIKADRERRKSLLQGYEQTVAEISRLLFISDPMGINFEENSDEYDVEAETIVPGFATPRLTSMQSTSCSGSLSAGLE